MGELVGEIQDELLRSLIALEVDRGANPLGQTRRGGEQRGTANVIREQRREFALKRRVAGDLHISSGQLFDRGHQGLGHVLAAKWTEAAGSRIERAHEV